MKQFSKEEVMKAALGLTAHEVAKIANGCSRGVDWTGCSKGHIAEQAAAGKDRLDVGSFVRALTAAPRRDHKKERAEKEAKQKAERSRQENAEKEAQEIEDEFDKLGLHVIAEFGRIVIRRDAAREILDRLKNIQSREENAAYEQSMREFERIR